MARLRRAACADHRTLYPARIGAAAQVSITFDSAGHLVRYSERRGIPRITGITRDMSDAQRDSAMRAAEASVRSTTINFD